jgi:hypothetical protein
MLSFPAGEEITLSRRQAKYFYLRTITELTSENPAVLSLTW